MTLEHEHDSGQEAHRGTAHWLGLANFFGTRDEGTRIGDHFTILNLGRQVLDADRDEVSLAALTQQMAGGSELEALSHELWE